MKDSFAKGLSQWNEKDDTSISNYTSWQFDIVKQYIGKRILEIGGGSGRITCHLLNSSESFERYTVIEPSQYFYNILKKRFPNVEVLNLTLDELDISFNGVFDTIFLVNVMEHVENDSNMLKQADRLLTPGGKMIIMVPAIGFLMSELDRNIGHFRRYDKKMIRKLAHNICYAVENIQYNNFIGILGWFWFCKIMKINLRQNSMKTKLILIFNLFDRFVMPAISLFEKFFPLPIGLNLMAVIQKHG